MVWPRRQPFLWKIGSSVPAADEALQPAESMPGLDRIDAFLALCRFFAGRAQFQRSDLPGSFFWIGLFYSPPRPSTGAGRPSTGAGGAGRFRGYPSAVSGGIQIVYGAQNQEFLIPVAQFDGRLGEPVVLRAHWQLFTGDGKTDGVRLQRL